MEEIFLKLHRTSGNIMRGKGPHLKREKGIERDKDLKQNETESCEKGRERQKLNEIHKAKASQTK